MKPSILMIIFFSAIVLLYHQANSQTDPATWFPQINETSHWTVGTTLSNGCLGSISKSVFTAPGIAVNKLVFASVMMRGIKIGSTTYGWTGANLITRVGEWLSTYSDRLDYYGDYSVGGYTMRLYYSFYKTGKYNFRIQWMNVRPPSAEIYLRMDYDLDGFGSDIVEYVNTVNNIEQWYAPANECQVSYNYTSNFKPNAVEYNAYCRIVNATSPATQFFSVMWPGFYSPVIFTFKRYAVDMDIVPPVFNANQQLQNTATENIWMTTPIPYAYNNSSDQALWVTLQCSNVWYAGIVGKVYQKPNGRPIKLYTYVMTGAWTPDFNLVCDNYGGTVNSALNELTNNRWCNGGVETNINSIFNGTGITIAQMHELMDSCRIKRNGIFNSTNRDNFRDFMPSLFILNSFCGGGLGVMFDNMASDINSVEREGSAILYKHIYNMLSCKTNNEVAKFTMSLFIHELGHCFNLQHIWGSGGSNFRASPGSIMTYATFWANEGPCLYNNVIFGRYMHFYGYNDPPETNRQFQFYQFAPESWVKPGRYGTFWTGALNNLTSPPVYFRYGQ